MIELTKYKEYINIKKEEFGEDYSKLDLVCCTKIGTPITPTEVRKKMKKTAEKSGIPHMKFHGWRHLHASLLLSKGNNI